MSDIEREAFERWLFEEQGLTAEWDEKRNLFNPFPAHLAWRAWQAARQAPASGEVEPLGYAPARLVSRMRSGELSGISVIDKPEDGHTIPVYTHPPAKVPEVLALCEQCHKEFSVPLESGGNATADLLCNFCNCPHCNTRNDLWIKLTTPTPATTPQPAQQGSVPEGWEVLPEDLRTHLSDFKDAVICKAQEEAKQYPDDDYWAHQLKVIEEIEILLTKTPQHAQQGSSEIDRLKNSRRRVHDLVLRWEAVAAKAFGTDSLKQVESIVESGLAVAARIIQQGSVPKGYTPVRTLVLNWLLGETEAFEPVDGERGQFWWRKRLREAILDTDTTAQPEGDGWIGCSGLPDDLFSVKDILIDCLRDTASAESKVDTCYDQPNKNPSLAIALNWLADFVATGLKRPQPPKQEGE